MGSFEHLQERALNVISLQDFNRLRMMTILQTMIYREAGSSAASWKIDANREGMLRAVEY